MPIITGTITDHGAVIAVRVGVSRNREIILRQQRARIPQPLTVSAQIDTGSFVTAFPQSVFDQLGIAPFTRIAVQTPSTKTGEPHYCDQFDVSVDLVSGMTVHRLPSVKAIAVDEFDEHELGAIIGRDILQICMFQYDGRGRQFSLVFRRTAPAGAPAATQSRISSTRQRLLRPILIPAGSRPCASSRRSEAGERCKSLASPLMSTTSGAGSG
jgi:hypothetical protein